MIPFTSLEEFETWVREALPRRCFCFCALNKGKFWRSEFHIHPHEMYIVDLTIEACPTI